MARAIRRQTGMWEYLEASGVLETKDDKLIEKAKREYKRIYQRQYRKLRRKQIKEVNISLDKADWEKLDHAAQEHHYSLPAFVKQSALSYINQTYLVPDREPITRLEQRLRLCQTDIRVIAKNVHKLNMTELNLAFIQLAERIQSLEDIVVTSFTKPPKA